MRIAAGVLLIIVGIMNGLAGMGYAAAGGGGELAVKAAEEAVKTATTPEAKKQAEANLKTIKEGTGEAKTGGMAIFGIFLIVMLGLQIAGAVCLFTQKAAKFVLIVAVLGLVAEFGGLAFGVKFGITNILGIVAAVLAFLGAKSYMAGGGAAAA